MQLDLKDYEETLEQLAQLVLLELQERLVLQGRLAQLALSVLKD